MKLTTRARYSVRLMMAVAKLGRDGRPVSLEVASRHCNVSLGYLGQLATVLSNTGLLRSRPGPGGGFLLARDGADISVLEVIESAIGRLTIARCIEDPALCPTSERCGCREIWALVNARVRHDLSKITLDEMVSRGASYFPGTGPLASCGTARIDPETAASRRPRDAPISRGRSEALS